MRTVIDLSRWQDYLHIYIGGELRRYPQMRERLPPDFGPDHTRDTIVNMVWNELHRGTKYKWEPWDVDAEVEKWFVRYYPHMQRYNRRGRTIDETDRESEYILDCLDRLQKRIAEWVIDNDLMSPYRIYDLYSRGRETFMLEIWGDQRIREWSEERNIKYDQYSA